MRKLKVSTISIATFLVPVLAAGCGDADKNPNAGNPGAPLTPPIVTFVTPPDGSTMVCPDVAVITTFSKAMNPATINTSAFTLSAGGTSVAGAVTYNTATLIATFTPAEVKQLEARLALHSIYFATARPTEKNPGVGLGGSVEYNKALTERRVARTKNFLVESHAHQIRER